MRKDTWTIIGVMVALFGLQATLMVTGHASIESRMVEMDGRFSAQSAAMDGRFSVQSAAMDERFSAQLAAMDDRLTAMDGRLYEINTRLSRIEGHLGLPTVGIEPDASP